MPKLTLRQRIGRWIAGQPAARKPSAASARMYHAARPSRLTQGWPSVASSADAELSMSLARMRGHSRALVRDAGYARRARNVVVNNVIGSGIGLQAQVTTARGSLAERANSAIERAWEQWCAADSCHTGGRLHFADLERAAMAQVFEAGEVILRIHRRTFGNSAVPLALEMVEAERVADQYAMVGQEGGNTTRLGIEVDRFCRPVAYYLHDWHFADVAGRVGMTAPDQVRRVDAGDIIHLFVAWRSPQSRGEPWMHAGMRKLNDMDGYSEAEIVAARANANVSAFIESPESPNSDDEDADPNAAPLMALAPGTIEHLAPGEKFAGFTPNRPNPNMDPFMRSMLREVAAAIDVSYESLSRDYSQSNYSSSRLALLDDRDTWQALQRWWVRSFREVFHKQWLQAAVLARAIPAIDVGEYANNPTKFEAVKWKPRGWSWVDPTKEVEAYTQAIRGGLTTLSDVIAKTADGRDLEDVIRERQRELRMLAEAGIAVDTSVIAAAVPDPSGQDGDDGRVVQMSRAA